MKNPAAKSSNTLPKFKERKIDEPRLKVEEQPTLLADSPSVRPIMSPDHLPKHLPMDEFKIAE